MHLRSIYYKFVLGYFIFGLLGFISISTIGSRMILNHLLESQVDALYNEATVIAEQCSSPYQGSKVAELSSVFPDKCREMIRNMSSRLEKEGALYPIDKQGNELKPFVYF